MTTVNLLTRTRVGTFIENDTFSDLPLVVEDDIDSRFRIHTTGDKNEWDRMLKWIMISSAAARSIGFAVNENSPTIEVWSTDENGDLTPPNSVYRWRWEKEDAKLDYDYPAVTTIYGRGPAWGYSVAEFTNLLGFNVSPLLKLGLPVVEDKVEITAEMASQLKPSVRNLPFIYYLFELMEFYQSEPPASREMYQAMVMVAHAENDSRCNPPSELVGDVLRITADKFEAGNDHDVVFVFD